MNTTIETILTRASIRHFTTQPVERQKLDLILNAAIHAPSGKNLQTWRFTVLCSSEKIAILKATAIKTLEAVNAEPLYGFNNPDKVIIVTNRKENHNAYVDGACAIENMLLAAHSLQLGACWINGLRTICDEEEIRTLLREYHIPDNHIVVGLVVLGYPAVPPTPVKRRSSVIYYLD